jgi:hypothetical protein
VEKPSGSLIDLLGEAAPPKVENSEVARPAGAFEALAKPDFVVFGQAQKNPGNPKQIALRLLFFGTGKSPLTDVRVEYQIQPGWQLNAQPMDGTVLLPRGSSPLSQILYLVNQTNAPFSLHLRCSYKFGSQPLVEVGVINTLQ